MAKAATKASSSASKKAATPSSSYPTTPDGRYFLVKSTLWRCTNPSLSPSTKAHWVSELMSARRDVKSHRDDPEGMKEVRKRVQEAKEQLGERGEVWWTDGSGDVNRKKVWNTGYKDWAEGLEMDKSGRVKNEEASVEKSEAKEEGEK